MKIFPDKSLLSIALASVLLPHAYASKFDARGLSEDSVQQASIAKKSRRNAENLYVVLLKDAPLAGYHGDNNNFAATSIQANSANKNNKTGLLDISSSASKTYISHLKHTQRQVLADARSMLKRKLSPEISYQIVLNGFSTRLKQHEAEQLVQHEQIRSVIKVTPNYLTTDSGPGYIKAPTAWDGTATGAASQGEGIIVGIMDTGISPFNPSFADVAADGYNHTNPLGEGNYLGDCRKSDLARYCNDKLIGIWAHPEILEDYTPAGDEKIGVDHNGHGSHTASTAAGNPVKDVPVFNVIGDEADFRFEQISGVAPRANIVSYQVCDGDGSCWPDVTAQAVEHAIANGIKVINYSVGGAARSPWESVDAQAFLAAREAGIHVATSAGNSGPGSETVGSPGNAPWVTTVAAYTHDRGFTDKSVTFSGGETELAEIQGRGATKGYSGAVIHAGDFGDGQCLEPFAEDTFDGQIVICERGRIARVEKGQNVLAGGAGGLILVNSSAEASSIDADLHVLPAIHVSMDNGRRIKEWLASGEHHQASIGGSELIKDSGLADIAARFTSRGPDSVFNRWMTPHVAAPGVNIYAANSEYQPHTAPENRSESPYTFMSGTSMASPHVAGALTLIAALKPEWTPAEAQSALMLTAVFDTRKDDGETPSDFFDAGSGSIRIDRALNSGLIMDVSYDNYLTADPETDGEPESLNMPAMLARECMIRCTWTRTVTATQAAAWTASQRQITQGVTITSEPSSFSLAKGQSIDLTVTAEIGEGFDSQYGFGRLMLTPDNEALSPSALPVTGTFVAGGFPDNPRLEVSANTGRATISGICSIPTDDLQIATFELAEAENIEVELPRDDLDTSTGPGQVYNDERYFYSRSLHINSKVKRLIATIKSTSSPDLDMYIGIDHNLNGKPDNSSELAVNNLLCLSATETQYESCIIDNPTPGSYYFAVHNYGDTTAPSGVTDDVTIELAVIGADDNSIKVTAPEVIENEEPFAIELSWNKPLKRDTLYVSALEMGSGANSAANIGLMQFEIYRNGNLVGGSLNTLSAVTGDKLTASIEVAGNETDDQRNLTVQLTLPQGVSVESDSHQGQLEAQVITWNLTQAANSADDIITVELGTDALVQSQQLSFELSHTLGDEGSSEVIGVVDLSGITVAKINGQAAFTLDADEQTSITLTAAGSSAPEADDEMTYSWSQLSGPEMEITDAAASQITISLPDVSSDSQAVFELTVSNGTSSDTATATINVIAGTDSSPDPERNNGSSGGATGIFTILLALIAIRRKLK